jgi:hypothetical protein
MNKKLICIACFIAGGAVLQAQTAGPQMFATPEAARDALVQATSKGVDALKELMGPESSGLLRTGDPVEDKNLLEKFRQRVAEKVGLDPDEIDQQRVTVLLGNDDWPFPVPLMRRAGRWYFDAREGKAEVRRRIVGANELDAIQVCRGYVEAQEQYAQKDWEEKGMLHYATKLASSPGKKDGLYWPGDESPVSEKVGRAMAEGYGAPGTSGKGYHGYRYKILVAQGADAAGGEEDYVAHGLMIGGFALVGWPVEYGVSGIMSFIVNQDGVVYEKDLGPRTDAAARAMTKFNPDKTWTVSQAADE